MKTTYGMTIGPTLAKRLQDEGIADRDQLLSLTDGERRSFYGWGKRTEAAFQAMVAALPSEMRSAIERRRLQKSVAERDVGVTFGHARFEVRERQAEVEQAKRRLAAAQAKLARLESIVDDFHSGMA